MQIKYFRDNRQQLRELFYKIAADIKKRNFESKFLDDFEIINVQRGNQAYPAFRNRKGGKVISVTGDVTGGDVELSIHEVVELTFGDHEAYANGKLDWWEHDWPVIVYVSIVEWERLVKVELTDVWQSSRAVLRRFLEEAQAWHGEDQLTDTYIDRILRIAYPESNGGASTAS